MLYVGEKRGAGLRETNRRHWKRKAKELPCAFSSQKA